MIFLQNAGGRWVVALGSTALVVFAAACGVNVDDLFQSGNGDGSGGSSSSGTKSATSTAAQTMSNTVGSSTSATHGATSSVNSGPQTVAVSVQASSSTGSPQPTVGCGATAGDCAISQGGCCYNSPNQTGNCAVNQHCSNFETQIKCQTGSDCNGGVCCGKRSNSQSPYDLTECDTHCQLPARVLCDPMNPQCDPGETCQASTLLPQGYYVCGF